jgi:hypothetical protein
MKRPAYAVLALALLGLLVFLVARHDTGWWRPVAFGLGPDVALVLGIGSGLARGQLHPRAVPLYNLLHRFWGPLVLALLAWPGPLSVGFLAGAVAWGFHIAVDRTLGYGLRTRDGFQRDTR